MLHPGTKITSGLELHIGGIIIIAFLPPLIFSPEIERHRSDLLAERGKLDIRDKTDDFVTEDLSRHAFWKDYAVGLIQRPLASFEHIETEHFQDSGSHVPRIFLVARPLSAILYIEKTAFGPSTQKASFLYKRRRPGKRPRERTADNGLRPFASVHDIHPEDSIGVRVAAVERIIIIHLHHNEHKRHKSNAQPQHIQNRSRLEPAEHTKEISQNRFHIQLFCFNTNKKYAK